MPAVLALGLGLVLNLSACLGMPSRQVGAVSGPASTVAELISETPGAEVGRPATVEIPAIAVAAQIVEVGLQPDGAMEVPDFGLAGWYGLGPRPGAPGPSVVVAHVDSQSGPDVFLRLHELQSGDRIHIGGDDGLVRSFVVEGLEQVPKHKLPVDKIWVDTEEPLLRLITCGGSFDRSTGHYRDNVIVYARAA